MSDEELTSIELDNLPSGALVKDHDEDYYEKQGAGYWQRVNRGPVDMNYQKTSSYALSDWSATLVREDVGQDQGKPETWGYTEDVIVDRTLTGETHTWPVWTPNPGVTPAVVLDARFNFVEHFEAAGIDSDWASRFFSDLARDGHVTDKFFLDFADLEN